MASIDRERIAAILKLLGINEVPETVRFFALLGTFLICFAVSDRRQSNEYTLEAGSLSERQDSLLRPN
jgi:hypothetical protein